MEQLTVQIIKERLIKLILDNEREMFHSKLIDDVYYFSNINNTLREVFSKLFNYDLTDKEQVKLMDKEINKYRKQ